MSKTSIGMTHLQLNQLGSLPQSVTGLQQESVHPVTMPTEQDLAEKLPDIHPYIGCPGSWYQEQA